MSDSEEKTGRLAAAARWYSALQDPDVELGTWDAFLAWERDPENAAAFRHIEASLAIVDRGLRESRGGSISQSSTGRVGAAPRRRLAWIAGIAAVIAFCAFAVALTAHSGDAVSETYATDIGEQRMITLADGSLVTLNTDSAIEVAYSPRARHVSLARGQALFEVEQAGTPFVVRAGDSETRALGTRFEIYLRRADVAVTLLEGSVAVSSTESGRPDSDITVLKPGERLEIAIDGEQILSHVDPATVLQWRSGMVQFDAVTLAEAIKELNRYSETRIRVLDPNLASERLSGTFPMGQPEEFVSSLSLFLPVRVERSDDLITLVPIGPEKR